MQRETETWRGADKKFRKDLTNAAYMETMIDMFCFIVNDLLGAGLCGGRRLGKRRAIAAGWVAALATHVDTDGAHTSEQLLRQFQ